MSLNRGFHGRTKNAPIYVRQAFADDTELYYNTAGLDMRLRQDNYPAIVRVGSIHVEKDPAVAFSNNNGDRYAYRTSVGIPLGLFQATTACVWRKPSTSGTFYVASSSANDTSAGTGARTVFIRGLLETSSGIYEEGSETITLNGQTSVATANSNWFRVNLMFVLTAGTGTRNAGAIYISDVNAFTAGVPTTKTNAICAIIGPSTTQGVAHDGYGVSTTGDYSVGTYQNFIFNLGNIFTGLNSESAVLVERYTQPFNSTTYQVGFYGANNISYDYRGAGAYTAKTDVRFECFDKANSSNIMIYFTYYIEFVLVDNRLINSSPINFNQV